MNAFSWDSHTRAELDLSSWQRLAAMPDLQFLKVITYLVSGLHCFPKLPHLVGLNMRDLGQLATSNLHTRNVTVTSDTLRSRYEVLGNIGSLTISDFYYDHYFSQRIKELPKLKRIYTMYRDLPREWFLERGIEVINSGEFKLLSLSEPDQEDELFQMPNDEQK